MGRGLGRGRLGRMPLGGAEQDFSLNSLINYPVSDIFRRAQIQRRSNSTGQFDGVWQDISEYVKRWGTMEAAIDDVRLNRFRHSGINLTARNDTGAFNYHTNINSLWYGYLTRYRTLVRIQAGYLNGTDEYPSDTTMGIFVMDDEIPIRSDSNDISLKCSSLLSIFDEVRARDIGGLGSTLTASEIIAKIRDHTDGAGVAIFRQFITSTAWSIQSTSSYYRPQTDTADFDNLSAWELMEKLAESEGYIVFINRTGGVEFRSREARQGTSQFSFYGQDFPRPNIIAITDYKEALNKYFNFFRLKYLEADTSTSYVTAGTTTVVDASNPSWANGQRVYDFENTMINNTATAQTLVDGLRTTFGTVPPQEGALKTVFIPHVEILDRVDSSFHSYDLAGSTLWDVFDWDGANWSVEGENFDWNSKPQVILSRGIDLDNFTSTFRMRDI